MQALTDPEHGLPLELCGHRELTPGGPHLAAAVDGDADEIIPLATLTHELGGGADWPAVGDWEHVTTDLVHSSTPETATPSVSACPRSRAPSSA